MAPFSYPPLPPSHIRILILEPSPDHLAPLQFSFHTADFEVVQGKYEAISYTWGEPNLAFPLHHVDGSQVLVTENLDLALRRVRRRLDQRWLWADAACINQVDDREKEVQIPLMGQIFRGAIRVIAWLGPGGGEEEEGMRLLESLTLSSKRPEGYEPEEIARSATCLDHLFNLTWFTRLWIVQECALNIDLSLICGHSQISLWRLFAALPRLHDKSLRKPSPSAMERVLDNPGLIAMRKLSKVNTEISLIGRTTMQPPELVYRLNILSLVDDFSYYGCSDDRDRIFALFGLASNVLPTSHVAAKAIMGRVYMDVNYSIGVQDVFENFAVACVNSGMMNRILGAILKRPRHTASPNWPSWVPDWRVEPTKPTFLSRCLSGDLGSDGEWNIKDLSNSFSVEGKTKLCVNRPCVNRGIRDAVEIEHLRLAVCRNESSLLRRPPENALRVCDFARAETINSMDSLLIPVNELWKSLSRHSGLSPSGEEDVLLRTQALKWLLGLSKSDSKKVEVRQRQLWDANKPLLRHLWDAYKPRRHHLRNANKPRGDAVDEDGALPSRLAAKMENRSFFTAYRDAVSGETGVRSAHAKKLKLIQGICLGLGPSTLETGDVLVELVTKRGLNMIFKPKPWDPFIYYYTMYSVALALRHVTRSTPQTEDGFRVVGEARLYSIMAGPDPNIFGPHSEVQFWIV